MKYSHPSEAECCNQKMTGRGTHLTQKRALTCLTSPACYKQQHGKINNGGKRDGITSSEVPHENGTQHRAAMISKIMQMEKKKQPPRMSKDRSSSDSLLIPHPMSVCSSANLLPLKANHCWQLGMPACSSIFNLMSSTVSAACTSKTSLLPSQVLIKICMST